MLIRLLGTVAGLAAAWLLANNTPLGLGFALAGPVFAIALLLTALIAERFAPRPAPAGPRSASLAVRKTRDYLPRYLSIVAAASTVSLIVLLWGTTKAATADDQGRAGRAFSRVCEEFTFVHTPWPGSFYSVPILIASGVCLVLTVIVLRAITVRPRLGHDDADRRRAARVVVAAYGIAVLTPLIMCATMIFSGLSGTSCGLHTVSAGHLLAGAALAVIITVWIHLGATLLFGSKSD